MCFFLLFLRFHTSKIIIKNKVFFLFCFITIFFTSNLIHFSKWVSIAASPGSVSLIITQHLEIRGVFCKWNYEPRVKIITYSPEKLLNIINLSYTACSSLCLLFFSSFSFALSAFVSFFIVTLSSVTRCRFIEWMLTENRTWTLMRMLARFSDVRTWFHSSSTTQCTKWDNTHTHTHFIIPSRILMFRENY